MTKMSEDDRRWRRGTIGLGLVLGAILITALILHFISSKAPNTIEESSSTHRGVEGESASPSKEARFDPRTEDVETSTLEGEPSEANVGASKGRLVVVVHGRGGEPVEGASVSIERCDREKGWLADADWHRAQRPTIASGRSDGEGACDFRDLDFGAFGVVASHSELGVAATSDIRLDHDAPERRIVLRLDTCRFIEGRVVGEDGLPFEGARISPREWIQSSETPIRIDEVRSDVAGVFRVPLISPDVGRTELRADAEGHACSTVDVGTYELDVEPSPFPTITLRRSRDLRLQFVDAEGTGIPGDLRFAVGWGNATGFGPLRIVARTDATGAAEIVGIPSCEMLRVWIEDERWSLDYRNSSATIAFSASGVAVPLPPSSSDVAEVPLVRCGTIEGRLIDAHTGRPLGGLPMECGRTADLIAPPSAFTRTTVTDSDGAFRFEGLQRTKTYLRVVAPEWFTCPTDPEGASPAKGLSGLFSSVDLTNRADVAEMMVRAQKRGRVVGRVVDGQGRGIRDVRVAQFLDPRSFVYSIAVRHDELPAARTAEDGRFVLEGINPGAQIQVVIADSNLQRLVTDAFELGSGATVDLGDLCVQPGKSISFRVLGPEGPIGGVSLFIIDSPLGRHDPKCQRHEVVVDERGEATVHFITADRIVVEISSYSTRLAPAYDESVFDAPEGALIELRMTYRRSMQVEVTTSSGAPVQDATILFEYLSDADEVVSKGWSNRPTNVDGRANWTSVVRDRARVTEVRVKRKTAREQPIDDYDQREIISGDIIRAGVLNRIVVR